MKHMEKERLRVEANTSRVIVIRKQTALSEPTRNGKINRRVICTVRLKCQMEMKRVGGAPDDVHEEIFTFHKNILLKYVTIFEIISS